MLKFLNSIITLFKYILVKFFGLEVILTTYFFGKRKFICKNNVEFFRTWQYGNEEAALGAFLFLLDEKDTVWDIGSSVGVYSVYSAPLVHKVVAFEPDKEIFGRLNKNVHLNMLGNKVSTFNIGISDVKGKVSMSSDGLDGKSPSLSDLGRHANHTEVEVDTMDNLIKSGVDKPTVLKIDIEGAEILALRGGIELLKGNDAPRMIFMEIHPDFLDSFGSSTNEVINMVKESGYLIVSDNFRNDQIHLLAFKINS